jgi:hypothetical protein
VDLEAVTQLTPRTVTLRVCTPFPICLKYPKYLQKETIIDFSEFTKMDNILNLMSCVQFSALLKLNFLQAFTPLIDLGWVAVAPTPHVVAT